MTDQARSKLVLTMNTLAFAVCFAAWMMNAVLITFLAVNGLYAWDSLQVGVLMATPILTGSLLRLPVGILADKFGGRIIFFLLMLLSSGAMVLNSFANSYATFVLCALGFGLSGASFAVGVQYTSVWFAKDKQGTALGIFGMGNAGTAVTLMLAPALLAVLSHGGSDPSGWRKLPLVYAGALAIVAVVFWLFTTTKKPSANGKTLGQRLAPLRYARVWRFGLYYFLVFGGFVALSNWLVPYYVKAYGLPLATAAAFVACFALPTSLTRAVGGWLSDKVGARRVMYWVLSCLALLSFALFFPQMDVFTPGEGILAGTPGKIVAMSESEMTIENSKSGKQTQYRIVPAAGPLSNPAPTQRRIVLLPRTKSWNTWASKTVVQPDGTTINRPFQVGDTVERRELLAKGTTHIHFQANVYIFTFFVVLLGLCMGLGMGAVFKHIPSYYPDDVGVVGGLVGVMGGLGGFFAPILFGLLLKYSGVWTTCWMLIFAITAASFVLMHFAIRRTEIKPAIQENDANTVALKVQSAVGGLA